MIKSMTGYGLGTASNEQVKYTVEIKSLNSKFLELNLRLPKAVSDKELSVRGICSKSIERGKVNFTITVEYMDQTARAAKINKALFQKYYQELTELSQEVQNTTANIFELSLHMPEVISQDNETFDELEGQVFMDAFYNSLAQFDQFRKDEGEVLKNELLSRVNNIQDLLKDVEAIETDRIPAIRDRLSSYMDKSVGKEQVDMNRFEQELIYYIDKLDITEEKVRLSSHCNYFIKALNDSDANGKKLGFISQEIGREINTLGSKANHARIQQTVVQMKEELEKIKEQLLNVL